MKIVGTDNFARENVADFLVAENIKNKELGDVMCKALNDKYCSYASALTYYILIADDYKLKQGMEDLV